MWNHRLKALLAALPPAAAALLPVAHGAAVPEQEYQAALHGTPDIVHGETLFSTCAACHGPDGAGARDGSVPAIAGQHFRVIVHELIDYRHDKRWDLRMQHFTDAHHLSETQDFTDLAAYISGLPPTASSTTGDGLYAQHGAVLFARLCASCHGAQAEGDDSKGIPRLAGQHYEYLLRQMHDALEGRRPNFPQAHVHLLQRFDRQDLVGVADYLSRLVP
jgi:cytochrome c553